MASQATNHFEMTHKDGKPRRKLRRERLYQNGERVDLRKLAARRKLKLKK